MRKKPTTLSPVERALVAKKWNESTWDANIHALLSADVGKLVGKGGCVFSWPLHWPGKTAETAQTIESSGQR